MPGATWAIGSFLGGEISQFAQGRFDKPDYRFSMTACLNGFPVEIGAWTRRPGTAYGGHTKGGAPGRIIGFDFEQSAPITYELTDGRIRFRNGTVLITTNDAQVVVAVSSANPAVVQTTAAVTWATGDTLVFPGASTPLLENRQFLATKINTTHFSLADAITGSTIDGSTLGALVAGATVVKVHELTTSNNGGAWSSIRSVQAQTTDILLASSVAPQALTVKTLPSTGVNPTFAIGAATFNDGPYLDPFTNGAQVTSSGFSGIVALTLSFPIYNATQAYAAGAFVTFSGNNYVSLADQNVGNTPNSSPLFWSATSASAAINNGNGFSGGDVGRLVRLLSEPAAWVGSTTYNIGNVISYNPSGQPGATQYWQSLVNTNTGNVPGTDLTHWTLVPAVGVSLWTWGKITSLVNFISGNISGVAHIGNMSGGGGLGAAFDSVINKTAANSAEQNIGSGGAGTILTNNAFVGQNYSGTVAGAYAIQSATIVPSSDLGLFDFSVAMSVNMAVNFQALVYLFGSNTAPGAWNAGTVLASTNVFSGSNTFPGGINSSQAFVSGAPITLQSSDTTTTYKYVWVAVSVQALAQGGFDQFHRPVAGWTNATLLVAISQAEFVNAAGAGTSSSGINVEILGPPLLYSATIATWRLGVYSNATGWPTCGVYNDGRLYLGGAVGNRFDACVANGINGGTINFAPTDIYGIVSPASAISYTFNSDGVNPILWMKPDLQGVIMGTQAGEWLVQAPTAGPIAPTNITARNVTHHGGANVQPCRTEHTTIFVQRFAKKLLEYFPDVYSGKFSAPNIADKAQHITRASVLELAYTSAVTPVIWGRDALGALFGITYKRDTLSTSSGPTFYAWHRHTLGSGRIVESICSGPSTDGNLDTLAMVTNDHSTTIRHVELLTDTPDELTPLVNSWFLDDAVNPTSVSSTLVPSVGASNGGMTINGLWHLNGKTIQVFAGGIDCGDQGDVKPTPVDFTVVNGSVFVPYGDGISAGSGAGLFTAAFATALPLTEIVVGFTFTSEGQTTRPISIPDSGARNGPAFAKLSRAHRFGMKLVNTKGISVGGDLTQPMYPCAFKKGDGVTNLDPLTTFSGIQQDALRDDYGYEGGKLAWRITRPWPANVVAVGNNLMTQDQ